MKKWQGTERGQSIYLSTLLSQEAATDFKYKFTAPVIGRGYYRKIQKQLNMDSEKMTVPEESWSLLIYNGNENTLYSQEIMARGILEAVGSYGLPVGHVIVSCMLNPVKKPQ